MQQSPRPETHHSTFSSPDAVRAHLLTQRRRHELIGAVRVGVAKDVRELTIGSLQGAATPDRERQ